MYYMTDDDTRYNTVDEVLESLVTAEYFEDDYESFDDYVNETTRIEVLGYRFDPSEVLYKLNEDAYTSEIRSWAEAEAEAQRDSYRYDLIALSDGETTWICGERVTAFEEEVEEGEYDCENYCHVDESSASPPVTMEDLEKLIEKRKAHEAEQAKENEEAENLFIGFMFPPTT